jgi:hypothetical protein
MLILIQRHDTSDGGNHLGRSIWNRSVTAKEFEPVYQEIKRRGAVLFFHLMVNGICSPPIRDFRLEGAADTTIEDTVVVMQMIVRQIPHRYPRIKKMNSAASGRPDCEVAQSHGQSGRRDAPGTTGKPSITARRFCYASAGHGSQAALRCVCEAYGPEHLVTGSDYPVLLAYGSYREAFSYIREGGLGDITVEQILHRNARMLFGA